MVVFGVRAASSDGLYDRQPKFTEVKWPFAMDEWGLGHAWRCGPENCGVEVNVFVRAKIGFCNCATGVSDDAELDRQRHEAAEVADLLAQLADLARDARRVAADREGPERVFRRHRRVRHRLVGLEHPQHEIGRAHV